MQHTHRVAPSDQQAQRSLVGPGFGTWTIAALGSVTFDMASPSDVSLLNAGSSKKIEFTAPPLATGGVSVEPGPCSAFNLYVSSVSMLEAPTGLYESSGEVVLPNTGVRFWVWDGADLEAILPVPTEGRNALLALAYEGPPMPLRAYFRPGMVPGVTSPTQRITWTFALEVVPRNNAVGERITIHPHFSAPPFMPVGASRGTYLFHNAPANPLPGPQPFGIRRIFRTRTLQASLNASLDAQLDAKIYGGPWKAGAISSRVGAVGTVTLDIERMLSQYAGAGPVFNPVLTSGSGPAVSADSTTPVDALRVAAYGTPGGLASETEILLSYP